MDVIMNVLMVIIAITSVIAVMLVLLNRGQGGGPLRHVRRRYDQLPELLRSWRPRT